MEIGEIIRYGVTEDFIKRFESEGIKKLYPPQEDAIKKGLMEGKNLILSVPTAAGKTLVASMAAIKKMTEERAKVIYIVPLVALANEKYDHYKKLFSGKWKVAISVGDLDSSNPKLARYDFIVCTTEKLDSLIRHKAEWIKDTGLVIVDEIHLLNDPYRGPTLEILLTQLKELIPKAQIIGLSATISNPVELSEWMNADLVSSDFRPVKLYEGVSYGDTIKFFDRDSYKLNGSGDLENSILENTIGMKKQALFFVSTRRNAESLAKNLSSTVRKRITKPENQKLLELSEEILDVLDSPTQQCRKLADCIKNGVAFHHAGLVRRQKKIIEDSFRDGYIKAITATPTLAMGVNLPAFRVVLRDMKRYYAGVGSDYIPVLEYKQIAGRAGRPQYDEFGESIICAKAGNEAEELAEKFIRGTAEKLTSKLAMEPILRSSILALVSNSMVDSEESLMRFFSKTFYAYQYGDMSEIDDKINEVLSKLVEWEFISNLNGKLVATRLGKRVSELYLDPFTANHFIYALEKSGGAVTRFGILQLVSNTLEMKPLLSVKRAEYPKIEETLAEKEHLLLQQVPTEWDMEFDEFVKSIKTSMFFESWINELPEDYILKEFNVAPGEIRWRLQIADWLIYSVQELALLLGMKTSLTELRKTRILLKYGIKEELVPLVKLKGIGRVRARKLVNSGIKSIDDMRKTPVDSLSRIIGQNVAYSIKDQLGEILERPKSVKRPFQSNLEQF